MFSCEICEICWNAFFAEHRLTTVSDCSSIHSKEGRIGKQNCKLLERAVQAKEQISEAVVRGLQIRCSKKFLKFLKKKSVLESLCNKVSGPKVCNSNKKRLQHSCFPVKFANFLRTPILQNSLSGYFSDYSYFQRSPEQTPVRLSSINTIFSCKKVFAATKTQKQP